MEERQYSIPAMTLTDLLSLHPQHQYFQYYYSSPTINNTAVDTQMSVANTHMISDINYGGVMSNTYCHQDPRVQEHQHSSTTLDVDVNYEVGDYNQEDNDYGLLSALINNHVENKEEEEEEDEIVLPWQAAADDDVSSWEWPRFGGTLESIIDQAPCLVPSIIQHVPDHGVHDHHGKEVEEEEEKDEDQVVLLEDQEYCHMVPQVLAEMENTVVQSKHSICNTEWMTIEEEDKNDRCYLTSHYNSTPPQPPPPPPPSYHSQREARKITEKRQMQRGKSSTTIPSSTDKRIKATILHNKSERKRRYKINDRLETLQKLLPNFHKTDKASMLDQVIQYVKKLQAQNDQLMRLGMFDNNNMPVVVHPRMMHYITTMQAMQQQQQQQQMSMMTQMGMGMGMSMNPEGLVMMPTASSVVHPNMRQK